jgi:hypothetical protein
MPYLRTFLNEYILWEWKSNWKIKLIEQWDNDWLLDVILENYKMSDIYTI